MRFRLLRRPAMLATAAVLSAVSVPALALVVPGAVTAASATSVSDAQAEVDRLGRDVEIASEAYNEAAARIAPLEQQLALAEARQADQQRYIDELRSGMAVLAAEAYKGGAVDPSLQLLTDDPMVYLANASLVRAVSRSQGSTLTDWQAALDQLQADQRSTAAKLAEIEALEQQMAAHKADVETQLASAEDLLATARRKAAERAAAALAASRTRQAGPGGDRAEGGGGSGGGASVGTSCSDVGVSAPDARAAAAIDFACAQLGKPYQWGGDGPGSYDCSGLTLRAWGAAGVSLPHSSRMQYSQGAKVSRSELRPGDLVFFYSPISHVGIYIGNGMIVHSPSSGDVVKISPVSTKPFAGAVRP